MDGPSENPARLSADDATLDAAGQNTSRGPVSCDSSSGPDPCCRMAMVEGTAPELTGETESLLRGRLRLAAGIMFFGYLVFLPQHFARADFTLPGNVFLFVFHCLLTIVLGALGGGLCRRCHIPGRRLRTAELVMFGLSAAFLAAVQLLIVLRQCRELVQIRDVFPYETVQVYRFEGLWLLLVLTYALFVPNTWRRAAVVIGVLAATPVLTILGMMLVHEEVRQMLPFGELTGFVLMMLVAAVTGVFGVDTIGSLRREAFEARQLGRYRLTKRIGAGGMGEVYLAEHQLMKRPCVVKLIRPDKAGDPRALARFQREVRATAKLSHWNTVEIFDYGSTEDDTFYYVMEYLPGLSLAELVERFGPLPPERAVHLLRQVCDALGEAHAAGLIHRDIKPGNIFAAQRGGVFDVAKLLDFGLVKPMADQVPIHLTAEGSITGSPLFMSPEQAVGEEEPDARCDIYSLGAVGYYLLTGRPPFQGDKAIKVVIAHVNQPLVPPSQHRPDVTEDLERVIVKCMAKAPADRYPSAAALAEALAGCQAADQWTRARAAKWWREHRQQGVPG